MSADPKPPTVTKEEVVQLIKSVEQSYDRTYLILADHFTGFNRVDDETLYKLCELYANSKNFTDYLSETFPKETDAEIFQIELIHMQNLVKMAYTLTMAREELNLRNVYLVTQ